METREHAVHKETQKVSKSMKASSPSFSIAAKAMNKVSRSIQHPALLKLKEFAIFESFNILHHRPVGFITSDFSGLGSIFQVPQTLGDLQGRSSAT